VRDAGLEQDVVVRDPLVERATRLFEFLSRVQQLKTRPPRAVDTYRREGALDEAVNHGRRTLAGDRKSLPSLDLASGDLAAVLSNQYGDENRVRNYLEQLRVIQSSA
jgi:hypothetical protein